MKLWSLLGNSQKLDGGAMFGNVPRAMWEHWIEPDADNRIPLACRALLAGADGVVSVASNIIPVAFRMLCDLGRSRDSDAGELDARLRPVFDFLGVESNPTPVKAILELQGIGHGLRLPLMPLSAEHRDAAVRIAATADALEHACLRARQ